MDKALSNHDIENFFNGKINVWTYDQLSDCQTIDDVLGKYGRAVILYFWQSEPRVGHWCCIFKTPWHSIEFFNSFGTAPDKTLDEIPMSFKACHGENFKTLTQLLYDCPFQIEYNDKCLQDDNSNVCGRYCILRLCCNDIPIDTFQELFTKNKKQNDRLVLSLVQ